MENKTIEKGIVKSRHNTFIHFGMENFDRDILK